jgi:hypothetical protein
MTNQEHPDVEVISWRNQRAPNYIESTAHSDGSPHCLHIAEDLVQVLGV